ncbi:hypothetical protein FACS1894123_05750 [Bacteroidia bacterium]|nr:hypothetical protein FACS1894123_05750 [Bacteroidia bacterium]
MTLDPLLLYKYFLTRKGNYFISVWQLAFISIEIAIGGLQIYTPKKLNKNENI